MGSFVVFAAFCLLPVASWAQAFLGEDAPFGVFLQPKIVSSGWSEQDASLSYQPQPSWQGRSAFAAQFGGESVKVLASAPVAQIDISAGSSSARVLLPSNTITTNDDFHTFFPDQQQTIKMSDKGTRYNKYTIQRHLVSQYDRALKRLIETLYIDTVINTVIQPILHRKFINLINIINQETHQPILYVRKNKPPPASPAGATISERSSSENATEKVVSVREEPLVVENEKPVNIVLPPIIKPAVVEKVDYNGNTIPSVVPPIVAPPVVASP